ncbi:MAG: D-aminoacyl-tRNA deacylase [Candidatus Sumerlaeia bacterium]|nr:D-aminoacyl-tRNA deacylase [Candidatus Sumerlaeia bacterium]
MRILVQRVARAKVEVGERTTGAIGPGLLLLVGFGAGDTERLIRPAAEKVLNLRIFPDDAGNMNRSLLETGGGVLVVSQFTLYADARKGRRPSFTGALAPADASRLCDAFIATLRQLHPGGDIETGEFGAMMEVSLVNSGPVTIWLDSAEMGWA